MPITLNKFEINSTVARDKDDNGILCNYMPQFCVSEIWLIILAFNSVIVWLNRQWRLIMGE